MLGLHCRKNVFIAAVRGLLIAVASLLVAPGLQDTQASVAVVCGLQSSGSLVVAHKLSCSAAGGILLDQAWNLCLLH